MALIVPPVVSHTRLERMTRDLILHKNKWEKFRALDDKIMNGVKPIDEFESLKARVALAYTAAQKFIKASKKSLPLDDQTYDLSSHRDKPALYQGLAGRLNLFKKNMMEPIVAQIKLSERILSLMHCVSALSYRSMHSIKAEIQGHKELIRILLRERPTPEQFKLLIDQQKKIAQYETLADEPPPKLKSCKKEDFAKTLKQAPIESLLLKFDALSSRTNEEANQIIQEAIDHLEPEKANRVRGAIWDAHGKIDRPDYGRNHAADNLPATKNVLQRFLEDEAHTPAAKPVNIPRQVLRAPLDHLLLHFEHLSLLSPGDANGGIQDAIDFLGAEKADEIRGAIWEAHGKIDRPDYGRNHAGDNLPATKKVIEAFLAKEFGISATLPAIKQRSSKQPSQPPLNKLLSSWGELLVLPSDQANQRIQAVIQSFDADTTALIRYRIWQAHGERPVDEYGRDHAADNLGRTKSVIEAHFLSLLSQIPKPKTIRA